MRAEGVEHVPESGGFVLALNHVRDGASGQCAIAALDAVAERDPTAMDRVLMIAGRRERAPKSRFERAARFVARALTRWFRRRWSAHFAVISMEGTAADWGSLRAWKRAAAERISVVFPEGIASLALGAMRPGAGRWLATFECATVPCAVWFHEGQWHVRFGAPIAWSKRASLRDVQLGLALAALLPVALRGLWERDLQRLRALEVTAPE